MSCTAMYVLSSEPFVRSVSETEFAVAFLSTYSVTQASDESTPPPYGVVPKEAKV